jgi:hypothetical protein
VLTVPAGTGATFINDTGGSITSYVAPAAYVFVDSGNAFEQGSGEANPWFSRPGASPVVIVHGAALTYTGNGRSNIEIQGDTTLLGSVPSQALLAIQCAGTEPAVLHTSSFTNAGFIGLYGNSVEKCTSGRTLSVDSSAGSGTGTLTNTGEIEGFGTIAGNVINTGRINPGDSFPPCSPCFGAYTPGQITVGGNYAQSPSGILGIINLISDASGAGYSQLSVGGTASIDGTLDMLNGTGVAGDITSLGYKVLTAARDVVKLPTITVTVAGKGVGYVTSAPDGMYCSERSCVAGFPAGQRVTLTAAPGSNNPFFPNSTFGGWSGAGCHGTGSCTVTMTGDQSVTATFLPPQPPRCTLSLKTRRPKPTLTAITVCNKGAGLKLTGTVTEWFRSHRRLHTRRFQLRPVPNSTMAGQRTPLVIKLPPPALRALKQGRREAIKLTLASTDPSGTRRLATRQIPLLG